MSLGTRVKSIAHSIAFRTGLSTAAAKAQPCARIIMYHGFVSRERSLLAQQLEYLSRHFQIISLELMADELAKGNSLRRNEVALTFDDGLRNNATVVYPILKQLRIPAAFFVCPGLIETRQWLWTHEARCRLQSMGEEPLRWWANQLSEAELTSDGIVEWMKTLALKERQFVEAKIRQVTPDFQPTAEDREAFDLMDWHDLASLDPELITIGSHTLTHPILPTLTQEEVNFEIGASRRQLEEKLGRPVKYFCYPNGSHHNQSCMAVKQNYDAAVTAENGVVSQENAADLYRLPRIPAAESCALMAWRMHHPRA